MTPTNFQAANQVVIISETDAMHVRHEGEYCLSCWRLTWFERLSALLFGRVWVCVRGHIHPPILVAAQRQILE